MASSENPESENPELEAQIGQEIVLDLASPYVMVGRFVGRQGEFLLLRDADVHDLRDTTSTREQYVLNCRGHGTNVNRQWVWVSLREIVAISRLQDGVLG